MLLSPRSLLFSGVVFSASALLGVACSPDHPIPDPRLAETALRAFHSADGGQSWTLDPTPLARGLDSLGLSVRADGEVWVTVLDHVEEPPWWEYHLGPRVRGMVRAPGGNWEREWWWPDVGDTRSVIDPQWHGDELWFVSRPFIGPGDPADVNEITTLRVAPGGRSVYSALSLADPSPVTFKGELHVFVTELGRGVVHLAGEPLTPRRTFGRVTVPFATIMNGELWLIAQTVVRGHRYPVVARSSDARQWTDFEPLLPLLPDGPQTCTSPVIGPQDGGLVLLCVDERVSGPGGDLPPERRGRLTGQRMEKQP